MYLLGYLTFDEYQELGGKCTKDTFPNLQFDIEAKMDYITEGRLSKMLDSLGMIPDVVKMLEVKLINIESNSKVEKDENVTSYSNGIETFSYGNVGSSDSVEASLTNRVRELMLQYLYPKYPELFYRGRWLIRREQ